MNPKAFPSATLQIVSEARPPVEMPDGRGAGSSVDSDTYRARRPRFVLILPPIILYFLAQKIFTQGVVFTGIKG